MKKPQNIYDNNEFYNEYKTMREKEYNANTLIEIPIIKSMLPELKDKVILDLGCGNGSMSKYFANMGAKSIVSIDISQNMINEAIEKNSDPKITYMVMGMEEISSLNQKFDIIFSSLAFHYIEDFNKLITDISSLLVDQGVLVYSQEHPIATAIIFNENVPKYVEINDKRYYLVSDYNNNGERKMFWNVNGVIKYHRNFSSIINTIIKNNLSIAQIEDAYATDEVVKIIEKYKYQNDRPYFLFVKATKH